MGTTGPTTTGDTCHCKGESPARRAGDWDGIREDELHLSRAQKMFLNACSFGCAEAVACPPVRCRYKISSNASQQHVR